MALSLDLQNTTDRFAKSTQHLITHLSKQLAAKRKSNGVGDEFELSAEENIIRCQINFDRLSLN